jgi:glycosyltransferase involved in cell wall biosynthesis
LRDFFNLSGENCGVPARLLIVSFSVCPAPDRHGVALLNALKALSGRYQVDVLTLKTGELAFVEKFMKARMLRVPVGQGALGEQVDAFRRAVKRQLEGEEYDVVHLRSAWGGRAVVQGAGAARVVYEVARSTEGEPRAADEQLARALADEEAVCLERADLVLVPTQTARQHLLKADDSERVVTLPPGVDIDHFDWEPAAVDEPARVLYAGRISAGRGVRLLVQALEKLKATRPLKLVLAGHVDDPFKPILEEAIAAAGLSDAVELLGAIEHDDMPRVIAQATVCVAPASPDERDRPLAGFPTKLLEYMACRRAVVAPRRPSVEELVEDGKQGLLFEPGSADDLARAMGALLEDATLRESLADAGYARVRDEQPASATRRRLLEAYARIAPSSGWAPPGRAASPVDGFPSHPDTTTAKRPLATIVPDGRAHGERSGEIVITAPAREVEVKPGEVVIEAVDFASAGEPRDIEVAMAAAAPPSAVEVRESEPIALGDPFSDDQHTSPYLKAPNAIDPNVVPDVVPDFVAEGPLLGPENERDNEKDSEEEKTSPGPLRPRKASR